jgi:hypothetical protein
VFTNFAAETFTEENSERGENSERVREQATIAKKLQS